MNMVTDYLKKDFNSAVRTINQSYDAIVSANVRLRQKNDELLDRHYKDEELAKLREELKCIKKHSVFILSDEQLKIKEEFYGHLFDCPIYKKQESYTYKVTPTSIGTAVDLVCCCGYEVELIGL